MQLKKEWGIVTGLEMLAIALANWHAAGGVRTDEAKYLLSIPYPHPPLLRGLMSLTEILPFQELFWRLLLATLFVQGVWIVWDMTRTLHLQDRIAVCGGWLLSSALLTQAGSIMMASATAFEALVLLWFMSRPELCRKIPAYVALFWLATVMTAYQGVLLLPLAWSALHRAGQSRVRTALFVFAPVALLGLYSPYNPLALAAMLIRGDQGSALSLGERFWGLVTLWAIGGALVVSLVGTWGIVKNRDRSVLLTFILICAFLFFSIAQPYYTILFTPLFVAGLVTVSHGRRHPHAFPLLACTLGATAVLTWFAQPDTMPGPARAVMQAIEAAHPMNEKNTVLISGTFGHEWQYESAAVVRRYKPEFVNDAQAVVCLGGCTPLFNTSGWKKLPKLPVEAWVKM